MTLLPPSLRPGVRPGLAGRFALLACLLITGGLVLLGALSYAGLIVGKEKLTPAQIGSGGGAAYVYNIDSRLIRWGLFFTDGDDIGGDFVKTIASTLTLLEDGKPLGPAHSPDGMVRGTGGGAFSHCQFGRALFFSTSDNSDPSRNGRHYQARYPIKMAPDLFAGALVLALIFAIWHVAPRVARWSSPFEHYGEGERVWLFCLGTALALFAVPLLAWHLGDQPGRADYLAWVKGRDYDLYFLAFTLVPLVTWGACSALRHLESRSGSSGAVELVILVEALLLPVALTVLVLHSASAAWLGPLALVLGACAAALARGLPAVAAFATGATGAAGVRLLAALSGVALVLLPIALDDGTDGASGSRAWMLSLVGSPLFATGAAIGLAAVIACAIPQRMAPLRRRIERPLFILALLLVVLGSLQPGLMGDMVHLGAYLGPALAVLDGQVPLVGAQCQYGLSYLVFVAGFLLGIEPSYAGVVFISTLLNAVEFVIFMLLVRRLSNSESLAAASGLGALLLVSTLCPWLNSTPMDGGPRFLPPLALALALALASRKGPTAFSCLACLVWCVLWSIETCLWGLVTMAAAIVTWNLPLRNHWRRLIRDAAWTSGVVVLSVLVTLAIFWLWAGEPPRPQDYLEMLFAHVAVGGSVGWSATVAFNFLYWLPLGLILVLVLISGLAAVCSSRIPPWVAPLLPVVPLAALAIAEWTYFVGRSYWSIFLISSLPAAGVAVASFGIALPFVRKTVRIVLVTVAATVMVTALGAAVGPVDFRNQAGKETFLGPLPAEMVPLALRPLPERDLGLAHMIGLLFGPRQDGPIDRTIFQDALKNFPYRDDPKTSFVTATYRELMAILEIIGRHAPNQERLVIIDTKYSTAPLVFSRHKNRLPISNFQNDQLSPSLVARIAAAAPGLVETGEAIFVSPEFSIRDGLAVPDHDPEHQLGYAILVALNAHWTFALVADDPLLRVYRLASRTPSPAAIPSGVAP